MTQSKYSHSRGEGEEWGHNKRKSQRGKPSRTNTKPYSFIQHLAFVMTSASLQQACTYILLLITHIGSLLDWYLDSVPCFWHLQHPGIHTAIWVSPLRLYMMTSLKGLWPCYISPGLASFSWSLITSLDDPVTLTFCISPKPTPCEQQTPSCVSSLSHGLVPWGHSYSSH